MTDPYDVITLRLPASLLARVDRYTRQLEAGIGHGITFTRSDAMRALLDVGLSHSSVPAEKRRTKKKKAT
jgi:hypothetical protein